MLETGNLDVNRLRANLGLRRSEVQQVLDQLGSHDSLMTAAGRAQLKSLEADFQNASVEFSQKSDALSTLETFDGFVRSVEKTLTATFNQWDAPHSGQGQFFAAVATVLGWTADALMVTLVQQGGPTSILTGSSNAVIVQTLSLSRWVADYGTAVARFGIDWSMLVRTDELRLREAPHATDFQWKIIRDAKELVVLKEQVQRLTLARGSAALAAGVLREIDLKDREAGAGAARWYSGQFAAPGAPIGAAQDPGG